MCGNNTKARIAEALRQMMKTQPFHKISVQSLMEETNMKRQSFYYHFQDTREVLEWICRRQLTDRLLACQAPFPDRILYALKLLDQDRDFYRQVTRAAMPEYLYQFGEEILRPWLSQYLYHTEQYCQLNSNQAFVVDFTARAAMAYCVQFLRSREPLDENRAKERINALLETFRGPQGQWEQPRRNPITEAS